MNRSTVAIIAVATLLLGSGVSGIMFVKPALEEQNKLTKDKADRSSQKLSLESQVADLEATVKRQAMGTISYFDLRTVANQRREMEAKTVETLASLTEIFNDNKIDVQVLEPKGETQGLNKPVPTPAVSAAPAAGASPGAPAATPTPAGPPSGPPTEPPVQLTHKAFTFSVRGEYPNLVRALSEIQGLPKAISINQYNVELVQKPNDKMAKPPEPGEPVVSASMLELDFDLSITYLMAGGLPAGGAPSAAPPVPGAPGAAPSAKPISLELLHWASNWLGEPADAAELAGAQAAASVPGRPRFEVTGVTGAGGDLVVRTRRGVPRYRFSGSASRLVIELADTSVTGAAALAAHVPGVRAVSAHASATEPGAAVIVVETDGTRFVPTYAGNQLRIKRLSSHAAVNRGGAKRPAIHPAFQAANTTVAEPMIAADPATPQAVAAKPAAIRPAATKPGATRAAATRPAVPRPAAKGQKAAKGDPTAIRRVAPAVRVDTTGAETWSSLADRAAAEWASTQGGDREAFTPPVGAAAAPAKPAERPVALPVAQPVRATARPLEKPVFEKPVTHAAPVSITQPLARVLDRPLARTLERPVARIVAQPVARAAARPAMAKAAMAKPAVVVATRPATRMRGVDFENGALVVRTEGPSPTFKVVGGDRRSIILELDQTQLPGLGRLFAVGQAGVKQVRAALYDNHPPRVRLVVDTDGSVAVHPVVGPDGVLRLRLADRPGITREVRLASASTSAIVTTTKENPITRDPGSVKPAAPVRTVKPAPRPVLVVKQQDRRIVRGPAAQAAIRRAHPRRVRPQLPVVMATRPTASPTPMAKPLPDASSKIAPNASSKTTPNGSPKATPTPMPMPEASPPGPSLTRSLTTTYSFPIDREKTTGRLNPFKPIARPKGQFERKGAGPTAPPAKTSLLSGILPGMPIPGAGGPSGVAPVPKAPTGAGGGYALGGVMVGGGPPMALVTIGGKAYTVGLNETLPGNARVTAIKVDQVTLMADGREITLVLRR